MADPLTDGQIAEWRRYLDQGDWHQLVTDDEFRALLDTAAEVARLRGEIAFLREKGITVGLMKTSDRSEPYLAYDIRRGSELDDMPTLRKLMDAEQRIATITAERLAEAERLLRSVQFRCMSPMIGNYCPVCEMNPPTHGPDCSLAAFLARTTPQEK